MNRWMSVVAATVTALALASHAPFASAETQDEVVKRLQTSRDSERYNVDVPGQSIKAGGAQILVNAPLATVRSVVQEYGKYQEFIPRFKRSKVVGQSQRSTDVYLQVPILHGVANVWGVIHFGAPIKKKDGSEVINGRMLKGNVDDFQAKWVLIPIDANTTLLKSEILIVPKIPVPASTLTGELAYAADVAVTSTRNRAEKQGK